MIPTPQCNPIFTLYIYVILHSIQLYINTSVIMSNVPRPRWPMHSKVFLRMKTLWTWLCLLAARLWGHTRWCSAPAAPTSNNFSEVSLPQYYIIPYYTIFDNFSRPPNKCDKINVRRYFICVSLSWILFVSTCPVLLSLFVW